MQKVEYIRSKMLFGDFYPQEDEAVPEGLKFAAAAALTYLAPTLLFCYVIGQYTPLYVVACSDLLGVSLGLWMVSRQTHGPASCVPVNEAPDVPSAARAGATRKAA